MNADTVRIESLIAELRSPARDAGTRAWSPHSGFRVGAAVRDGAGRLHVGCNVESDSYGLTQCAERSALATAIAAGAEPRSFDALLIHVPGDEPLPPCGACRQWMVELMASDALVVSCCDGDARCSWRVRELLPDAFRMA